MKEKEIERLTKLKKIENDLYKNDPNLKYIKRDVELWQLLEWLQL